MCQMCLQAFGIETMEDMEEIIQMFDQQHNGNGHAPAKPASKVDPAKVAEGIRSQCDYTVLPLTGNIVPRAPITYACAKNGLFEIRHSDVATVTVRPKEVLGVTQELQEGVKLNLPKIPFLMLQQTIAFFRGVEQKFGGSNEAIVQIWWDREKQEYHMHIPEQQVSGGSVRHESEFDKDNSGKFIHYADIHSHTSRMSAFWSGVDNADEKKVCGERVFGVIGMINQPVPDWKWRLGTRGGFIDLNITDVVEVPQTDMPFRVKGEELFKLLNGAAETFAGGRVRLWCDVPAPDWNVSVPAEWYTKVRGYGHSHQSHSSVVGSFHGRGHGAHQPRLPGVVRGMLYIDNIEYEVRDNEMKPTGRKLNKELPGDNKPVM